MNIKELFPIKKVVLHDGTRHDDADLRIGQMEGEEEEAERIFKEEFRHIFTIDCQSECMISKSVTSKSTATLFHRKIRKFSEHEVFSCILANVQSVQRKGGRERERWIE